LKDKKQLYKYIVCDAVMALIAWTTLNVMRVMSLLDTTFFNYSFIFPEYNAKIVFAIIPFFWLFLYWLSGYYRTIWFKSRLSEFISTFIITIIGSIILFFLIIIDDKVDNYLQYYHFLLSLFTLHFCFTYFARLIITTGTIKYIEKGEIGFNTLILGVGPKAAKLMYDLNNIPKSTGYIVKGFVRMQQSTLLSVPTDKVLGSGDKLKSIINKYDISEIIIATEQIEELELYSIIGKVGASGVKIKLVPTKYQLITGSVKLDTIYGIPMIDLSAIKMNDWEVCCKRFLDVFASIVALCILSPICLVLLLLIWKRPIYSQERVGLHGKPFTMYKFRSMVLNAENGSPLLTSDSDNRVTPLGAFMRKYRLDEIPQFFNVIKGDMSIVGPRPERQFFIDKIVNSAPYYYMLQNVKPGITSWGMVKYGYANTVDQMIERASYDILYLENASILVDMKISIYTLKTIFTGEGM